MKPEIVPDRGIVIMEPKPERKITISDELQAIVDALWIISNCRSAFDNEPFTVNEVVCEKLDSVSEHLHEAQRRHFSEPEYAH